VKPTPIWDDLGMNPLKSTPIWDDPEGVGEREVRLIAEKAKSYGDVNSFV
jgi:hypothetical protein